MDLLLESWNDAPVGRHPYDKSVMRAAAPFMMLIVAASPSARPAETGFLDRSVRVEGEAHAYKVYVPPGFDARRAWPVILFLHGAGEWGTDNVQQIQLGLAPALRAHPERFPVVAVFPQAPRGQVWLGEQARVALAALDQAIAEFHGDPGRTYLAGLSMGAYGVWELAYEDPGRWAAIVAVSGGLVPPAGWRGLVSARPAMLQDPDPYVGTAARLRRIPAWLFHGAEDAVVPVTESRRIVAALEQAGAHPRYSEYPGARHNIWDRAFGDPDLPQWLLAQRRAR
jgi:predicted peptidase